MSLSPYPIHQQILLTIPSKCEKNQMTYQFLYVTILSQTDSHVFLDSHLPFSLLPSLPSPQTSQSNMWKSEWDYDFLLSENSDDILSYLELTLKTLLSSTRPYMVQLLLLSPITHPVILALSYSITAVLGSLMLHEYTCCLSIFTQVVYVPKCSSPTYLYFSLTAVQYVFYFFLFNVWFSFIDTS